MRVKVGLLLVAFGVALTTAAVSADDPIAARQALMKRNGQEARNGFMMAKGRVPFDAQSAADSMNALAADMEILPTLFPPGSDQGDTKATAAAFENPDDLKALAMQLGTDAKAAAAAAPDGVDAFATAFDKIDADCSACHQKYRGR